MTQVLEGKHGNANNVIMRRTWMAKGFFVVTKDSLWLWLRLGCGGGLCFWEGFVTSGIKCQVNSRKGVFFSL